MEKIRIRFQPFRHLFKEGFWIVVGQAIMMIGSLVGVRLLTGLLNPAEYGELALGMTIATLVNQTILGPLGQGVMRFYAPAIEEGDLGGYLYAIRRLALLTTIVIFCLMLVGVASLIFIGQDRWVAITIASLIFASINGYNSILNGIQNAARQRSVVALHQGIESWLRLLVAVLLISWLGANSSVVIIGYALGVTLVIGSQSIYFLRAVPSIKSWVDDKNVWQEKIWKFSWPISVFGIFTWFQLVSDRWALGLFRTTEEVGTYAALFQLGYYPISMASGIAVQFLGPIFFQRAGCGADVQRNASVNRLSWRLTAFSLGITVIVVCFAYLFHVQIFQVFVSQEYREVSYLLPWMILSGGIFAASQTIALNLMSQTKTHIMMPIKIMTALLGIALNLVGSYFYGTFGVVIASLIFSISCFLSFAVITKY